MAPKNDIVGYIYILSAERVLRGDVAGNIRIYEASSGLSRAESTAS